jgi:hypothetical protein
MLLDFSEPIGSGCFTYAYKQPDGRVLLVSCDPIKEVMAEKFPKCRLFPDIESIPVENIEVKEHDGRYGDGFLRKNEDGTFKFASKFSKHKLYITDWLDMIDNECTDLPKLNSRQRRFYNYIHSTLSHKHLDDDAYDHIHDGIERGFKWEMTKFMEASNYVKSAWSNVLIDLHPFNMAVKNGQLVLVDPFFPCDE